MRTRNYITAICSPIAQLVVESQEHRSFENIKQDALIRYQIRKEHLASIGQTVHATARMIALASSADILIIDTNQRLLVY